MSRRHSLRLRLTGLIAVVFTLGAAALSIAGYSIIAHTFPKPLSSGQLAEAAAVPATSTTRLGPTKALGRDPRRSSASGRQRSIASIPAAVVPDTAVPTVRRAQARQRTAGLRQALFWSLAAFAVVGVAAVAAGWQVAGRALAPVREMTGTARRISADDLTKRIALGGPKDEVRELAETFDGMLDRLQQAFDAQSRFVANASHELQTPLALLRTEADVVLADPDATREDLRDALRHVRAGATRSSDLVAAMLGLARSASVLDDPAAVDFACLVEYAVQAILPSAQQRGIDVRLHRTTATDAVVLGDTVLLRALVDNLLQNAMAYNVERGTIDVEIDARPAQITLRIENQGPNIPAHNVDGLFPPFARGDRSRARATGGAGLGLAIVRAVAEAHRGTANATAGAHGGLNVVVVLPHLARH